MIAGVTLNLLVSLNVRFVYPFYVVLLERCYTVTRECPKWGEQQPIVAASRPAGVTNTSRGRS